MCVGQYSRLRVDVVVVTPFYTLACVLSSYFSPVALQIIICLAPFTQGRHGQVRIIGSIAIADLQVLLRDTEDVIPYD